MYKASCTCVLLNTVLHITTNTHSFDKAKDEKVPFVVVRFLSQNDNPAIYTIASVFK